MDFCKLIPLIVGLISAILGYLLGKLFSKGNNHSSDIELWKSKNSELEASLAKCKASLNTAKSNSSRGNSAGIAANMSASNSLSSNLGATATSVAAVAFNAEAAKTVFGKKIKQDDLTIVEGIGPKISELFNENGIITWRDLAEATVPKLQDILNSKGQRYKVHDPSSWPMQSKMAYEGKRLELKKWQDEHDYGKA